LVLILEDAHWLDSASWALALALSRALPAGTVPLLLTLATRPLVEPLPAEYLRLRDDAATQRLILAPLEPEETLRLVCQRLGVPSLPDPVAALIRSKAEGHPFFS